MISEMRDALEAVLGPISEPLLVRVEVLLHERPHALAPLGDEVRDDSGHGLRR